MVEVFVLAIEAPGGHHRSVIELVVRHLVPLYLREWERPESDNQTNFFFDGSPSHMASLTLYRGLLSALMAFANGSSVAVVATGGRGDFQL